MIPLLWRTGLRHLSRHPWQPALAVLGIALGVAVVLAIDLAIASARLSFERSVEQVTGRTTHRILGDSRGVPEMLYTRLRIELGLHQIAPIVTGHAAVAEQPGKRVQVLGVDILAEAPFRDTLTGTAKVDFTTLITDPRAALLPPDLEDSAQLSLLAGKHSVTLHPLARFDNPALQGIVVTDIATAQALFGQPGKLSHIDLILPAGAAGQRLGDAIKRLLPAGLELARAAERNTATAELSGAFSLNLSALSLLALLVGMFLIYNAVSFSVVQRRALLGMLRALGVSRREIFFLIIAESLILGFAGTLLGAALGIGLGGLLEQLVTQTINDLYFDLGSGDYQIAPTSLAKGCTLGLLATLVAAWLPAREAAAAPPGAALSRAQLESRWQIALPRLSIAGLGLLVLGALILILSQGLAAGFSGLFLIVIGCALLTPLCLVLIARLGRRLLRCGPVVTLAGRDIDRHLSRTGVAVAALMVAFAATVGVGVMVDSFRSGVTIWLNDLLNADIYISAQRDEVDNNAPPLLPQVLDGLRNTDGVAGISTFRHERILLNARLASLVIADLAPAAKAGYRLIAGEPAAAWQAFTAGEGILISEPLAYRHGLKAGATLSLNTDRGQRGFTIVGIFHDYGSEHGRILINRNAYQRFKDADPVHSATVYAAPGEDLQRLQQRLENTVGRQQALRMRSNRDILDYSLTIFERTFTITDVLRLLAVIIAFVGVFSALLALQLERARDFAVLRSIGMTPREITALISLQTGIMGFIAGLLAIPTGLLLAAILIFVINHRAFGWTLPFQIDPWIVIQTLLLATVAALLAGSYPAWRIGRARPADALRTE